MSGSMNWEKRAKAGLSRTRGAAKDQFDKAQRYGRPMTWAQRKYLNHLRAELEMEPIVSGLTVYEASEQIDKLKSVPREGS